MDPELRELLDRDQIRELATRYSVAIDGKDLERLVALFDPEMDNERYGKGSDGVRAYYGRFTAGGDPGGVLHAVANHQIDFVDDQHATGVVYVRAFAGGAGTYMDIPALYLDEYVKREGRWYFSLRLPFELNRLRLEGEENLGYPPLTEGWAELRRRQAGGSS
jgi:hypothetical protein